MFNLLSCCPQVRLQDCRRVNLEPCTYSRLCDFVRDLFQVHNFNVKYEDDEGERISLSSDGELTEAFEVSRGLNVMLKLHVMVLADKPSPSAESLVQNSAAPSPSSTSSSIAASAQPPFEVSEASAQKETAGSFNDPPVLVFFFLFQSRYFLCLLSICRKIGMKKLKIKRRKNAKLLFRVIVTVLHKSKKTSRLLLIQSWFIIQLCAMVVNNRHFVGSVTSASRALILIS